MAGQHGGWPPEVTGELPRSSVLTQEKIPVAATTVGQARPDDHALQTRTAAGKVVIVPRR